MEYLIIFVGLIVYGVVGRLTFLHLGSQDKKYSIESIVEINLVLAILWPITIFIAAVAYIIVEISDLIIKLFKR